MIRFGWQPEIRIDASAQQLLDVSRIPRSNCLDQLDAHSVIVLDGGAKIYFNRLRYKRTVRSMKLELNIKTGLPCGPLARDSTVHTGWLSWLYSASVV